MGPGFSLIRRRPIVSFIRFYSANFLCNRIFFSTIKESALYYYPGELTGAPLFNFVYFTFLYIIVIRLYCANFSYIYQPLDFPGTRGLPSSPTFPVYGQVPPGARPTTTTIPYVLPVGWLYLTLLGLLNNACYVLYPFQLG